MREFLEDCLEEEECPAETVEAAAAVGDERDGDLDQRLFALNKALINTVKGAIDVIYKDNDFARFYVLETVARVPYFAYLSVLHLRETFGVRDPDMTARMRVHYAEADNELHHLLIMESLGGNSSAVDRTLAQVMAFGYYWYVVGVYSCSPQAAYHLSELIEDHAYHTYDAFLVTRAALDPTPCKQQDPSPTALLESVRVAARERRDASDDGGAGGGAPLLRGGQPLFVRSALHDVRLRLRASPGNRHVTAM